MTDSIQRAIVVARSIADILTLSDSLSCLKNLGTCAAQVLGNIGEGIFTPAPKELPPKPEVSEQILPLIIIQEQDNTPTFIFIMLILVMFGFGIYFNLESEERKRKESKGRKF